MKKNSRKSKKKAFAMTHQDRILMSQIMLGLSLIGIKSFSEACRKLNLERGNARTAVLRFPKGEKAQKLFKLANIESVQIKTTPTPSEVKTE